MATLGPACLTVIAVEAWTSLVAGLLLVPAGDRGRGVSPGFLVCSLVGARPGPNSIPVLGSAWFVQVLHDQDRQRGYQKSVKKNQTVVDI